MNPSPVCRDCKTPMEPGFQVDVTKSSTLQARWVPGQPVLRRRLIRRGEVSTEQWREAYRVATFRCPKCGLLDSYAIDSVHKT